MKKDFVRVTCDSCSKSAEFTKEDGYPYKDGWHYLYAFEFKVPKSGNTHKLQKDVGMGVNRDKHFCSVNCMGRFLEKKLMEASKPEIEEMENEKFNTQVEQPERPKRVYEDFDEL